MIQKLSNKLNERKKDNKGFTLVELIVATTILVILAAMLIPAMVGWIERSKEKSYAVEARAVYLAAQTVESDHYDGTVTPYLGPTLLRIQDWDGKCEEVKKLSGVDLLMIKVDSFSGGDDPATAHDILAMRVKFIPKGKSLGSEVAMQMKDGVWTRIELDDFETPGGEPEEDWDYDSENEMG